MSAAGAILFAANLPKVSGWLTVVAYAVGSAAVIAALLVLRVPSRLFRPLISRFNKAVTQRVTRVNFGTVELAVSTRRLGHPRYDVFISYRRDSDSQTARLVRAELEKRGFSVFLDVDDLRPGHFDEALLQRIQEAPSFVVILSHGSLDRCASPADWLRRETSCALAANKQIIPVLMPGFTWPATDTLPKDMQALPRHQGVPWSHEYTDAAMARLIRYLHSSPSG